MQVFLRAEEGNIPDPKIHPKLLMDEIAMALPKCGGFTLMSLDHIVKDDVKYCLDHSANKADD